MLATVHLALGNLAYGQASYIWIFETYAGQVSYIWLLVTYFGQDSIIDSW